MKNKRQEQFLIFVPIVICKNSWWGGEGDCELFHLKQVVFP